MSATVYKKRKQKISELSNNSLSLFICESKKGIMAKILRSLFLVVAICVYVRLLVGVVVVVV